MQAGVQRTIEREGVELFFTDAGEGFPVLLHTGGGGDGRMWGLAGYDDALASYRRITLDHRGRGRSDKPITIQAHRIEEYVADVAAVLDAAGVERAAIIGYSAGAAVAFATGAAHRDRIAAIVAIGNVPTPDNAPQATVEMAAEVRDVGMRRAMEEMSASEAEPAPQWLVDHLATTSTEVFVVNLEAWADDSGWDALARIQCPTLLVCGEAEVDPGEVEGATGRLRSATAVVLPGYGHLQTFWHVEVTAPIIARFLEDKLAVA